MKSDKETLLLLVGKSLKKYRYVYPGMVARGGSGNFKKGEGDMDMGMDLRQTPKAFALAFGTLLSYTGSWDMLPTGKCWKFRRFLLRPRAFYGNFQGLWVSSFHGGGTPFAFMVTGLFNPTFLVLRAVYFHVVGDRIY